MLCLVPVILKQYCLVIIVVILGLNLIGEMNVYYLKFFKIIKHVEAKVNINLQNN